MKLRFKLNQAEAFRKGIDVPNSIVSIEVNPSTLDQAARDLIADRLDGIDVRQIFEYGKETPIVAEEATFDSLMKAIQIDAEKKAERDKEINDAIIRGSHHAY